MCGPPDQKEAPKGVSAHLRGKTDEENAVSEIEAPAAVKRGTSRLNSTWRTTSTGILVEITTPEGGRQARSAAGPLPCLNSNKCNEDTLTAEVLEGLKRLSTNHRKTAFALAHNVGRLCLKYGIERIGFLTLTFADHVTCAKVAGRRFSSLRTGVLAKRYAESICVLERQKSGRIHYHLLVVMPVDIRTGFDFSQAEKGTYSSANASLRSEWAFWRATARNYGFGRTELMPVKSNGEGLSKYVGKYIAKHMGSRELRDKGVRLVRYSAAAKGCTSVLSWVSPRAKLWRWQVGEFCKRNGCSDTDALKARFGARWAYWQRVRIMAIQPMGGALWDVWHADRSAMAETVAKSIGADMGEVYMALFNPRVKPVLEYEVPKFSGVSEKRIQMEEQWVRTIVWADGRVERRTDRQVAT